MERGIRFVIISIACFCAFSCSENRDLNPEELGTNYFPLKKGTYSIFQVDVVEYVNSEDSAYSYQLKESVVDSFQNLESGVSYKLLRETRLNENDAWVTDSVWTARKDELRAIRIENNVPRISLVFPLKESKTWDANGFNSMSEDEYEMTNVGKAYAGLINSFDQTVTVIQEDIPDKIVNFISKKEIFSKDVGLVFKENIILKYKQGDFLGLEIVDSGLEYHQSLIEYGEE